MNRATNLILAALALSSSAMAQLQTGDILVSSFGPDLLQQYRSDGTHVLTTNPGTGNTYEGVTVTQSGLLLTTRRGPNGCNLFDPVTGDEVATFDTPEITNVPGDTAIFSDGTLAIADQGGDVELYSEAGTHMGTISSAGMTQPFGLYVDFNDRLWVGDLMTVGLPNGIIWSFQQDGTLLGNTTTTFEPGDLVRDPDGTIWACDHNSNRVWHLNVPGPVIGSFVTSVSPIEFLGIGMADDGSLWVTSAVSTKMFNYSQAGAFLGDFTLSAPVLPGFITIFSFDNGPGTAACFGDGSGAPCGCGNDAPTGSGGCLNGLGVGALLTAGGLPDTTNDSIVLRASGITAQPGLFFQGNNLIGGGTGASFGDGIRCCGQSVIRLEIVFPGGPEPTTASTSIEISSHPAQSGLPGTTKCYQYWYRNPGTSPCGSNFNLSNAQSLTWI